MLIFCIIQVWFCRPVTSYNYLLDFFFLPTWFAFFYLTWFTLLTLPRTLSRLIFVLQWLILLLSLLFFFYIFFFNRGKKEKKNQKIKKSKRIHFFISLQKKTALSFYLAVIILLLQHYTALAISLFLFRLGSTSEFAAKLDSTIFFQVQNWRGISVLSSAI